MSTRKLVSLYKENYIPFYKALDRAEAKLHLARKCAELRALTEAAAVHDAYLSATLTRLNAITRDLLDQVELEVANEKGKH